MWYICISTARFMSYTSTDTSKGETKTHKLHTCKNYTGEWQRCVRVCGAKYLLLFRYNMYFFFFEDVLKRFIYFCIVTSFHLLHFLERTHTWLHWEFTSNVLFLLYHILNCICNIKTSPLSCQLLLLPDYTHYELNVSLSSWFGFFCTRHKKKLYNNFYMYQSPPLMTLFSLISSRFLLLKHTNFVYIPIFQI